MTHRVDREITVSRQMLECFFSVSDSVCLSSPQRFLSRSYPFFLSPVSCLVPRSFGKRLQSLQTLSSKCTRRRYVLEFVRQVRYASSRFENSIFIFSPAAGDLFTSSQIFENIYIMFFFSLPFCLVGKERKKKLEILLKNKKKKIGDPEEKDTAIEWEKQRESVWYIQTKMTWTITNLYTNGWRSSIQSVMVCV